VVLAPLLLALHPLAGAQGCTVEVEPDDAPPLATPLTGRGPNAAAADAYGLIGTVCLTGSLASGDRDLFIWDLGESPSTAVWRLELEGPAGGQTVVSVFSAELAPDVRDLASGRELVGLESLGGTPSASEGFLLAPGSYLVGVTGAGAEGAYVARLVPAALDDVSRPLRGSSPQRGAFDVFGDLAAGLRVPFTIGEEGAGFAWRASLHAPAGSGAELVIAGERGEVVRIAAAWPAPVTASSLGLPQGEYVASVEPRGEAPSGPVRVRLEPQGRVTEGTELEPDDTWEDANLLPPGGEVRGLADGVDHYRLEVGGEGPGTWDLGLSAEASLRLRLYAPDGALLQERRGASGTLAGLHLRPGAYRLRVDGSGGGAYTLTLRAAGAAAPEGLEREPNDTVPGANRLGPGAQARGELSPQDVDVFGLEVAGAAERYRVQVVGSGVSELAVVDAAGGVDARARGEGRLRLDDLALLPGTHYLRVSGDAGEYALRAISLGPVPDEAATAAATPPEEPLAPTAAADPEPMPPADDDTAEAAPPPLPPPPPGVLEREPNDDPSRAHRLDPDAVRVGRLSSASDEDHYRFQLATEGYVVIELVPAAGETDWTLNLDGRAYRTTTATEARVVAESWLLAGDHQVVLRRASRDAVSSGYYQLRLRRLGTLGLPPDREPNDDVASAATLPASLEWSGRVGEAGDRDLYALPTFPEAVVMRLEVEADEGVSADVVVEGRGVRLEGPDEDGAFTHTLEDGERSYLRFRGSGAYRVAARFSARPDPSGLAPARADAPLGLDLSLAAAEVAAFWGTGQSLSGSLRVRNDGAAPVVADLAVAADVPLVELELPPAVEVGPGQTVEVPLAARLPADLADDAPITLQVAATSGGTLSLADAVVTPRCEAAPLGGFPYFPVAAPLLGHPNVLFAGFGARPPAGFASVTSDRFVNDGRIAVSGGGRVSREHSPTYELPGDGPVTLIGTVLNPVSGAAASRWLRRFEVQTSLDGERLKTAFTGELSSARVDQSFVFPAPVSARYARLVVVDDHEGDEPAYFGEWKLIAADEALFSGSDLAAPELGGHVVWSDPLLGSDDRTDVLLADAAVSPLDLGGHDGFAFVVGFLGGRAARLSELAWVQPAEDPDQLFDAVEVAVSLAGPAGPWRVVGTWPLAGAGERTAMALDEPVWARYVRLSSPKREGGRRYFPPTKLEAREAAPGDGYLSALGEWGTGAGSGPYELLAAAPAAATVGADDDDAPERATPLTPGSAVAGTVAVGEDVDWLRLTVPPGHNHLALRLGGDPTIAYDYELLDADLTPFPVEASEDGDEVVLSAFVAPGDYLLRLEEPKRTVVFSWDTSGSVSSYQPITYASLAAFADDVDGDREAVQLLAFDEPSPRWLLPHWSSDPERVQRTLTEWDRNADSSLAELALLTAVEGLREREGTKAVLLITDAETGGYWLTPGLWAALRDVRPRVFTFEVSSGGDLYPQQLMRSWAAAGGGVYTMAGGVGDFDSGFARASCLLRRLKRYTVTATTARLEPPGPGTLSVLPAGDAGPGAVHVIFDASGSMGQPLPSGEQRIAAAKRALEQLVGTVLEEGTPFSLRAFGHVAPSSCETRLEVPLAPLDREGALASVAGIEPKLLSQTAIADSLLAAVDDLRSATGPRTVILVTDGEESCGGDPAAAAAALRASGSTTIAIVSLGLDEAGLAAFEALAEEVGATYVDVTSFEELRLALADALRPVYEVYGPGGDLVATGRVGEAVELPMGVYEVRVLTSPAQVFEAVTVPGDGSVEVRVGGR
jgi:Mg-chelatase subunit ChlD